MILGLNCLSLLFTTTYEIQGLLLGQTPRKFALPTIKRAGAISSQTMIIPALSTGNDICSNSVTDNNAENIPEDIDMKPSVQEKTNWNNFKHAAKIAIANLLGGWDENV